MKMPYMLLDTEDGNAIGTYPTEDAALDVVRSSVESFGYDSTCSLGLVHRSDDGPTTKVADGATLIELAQQRRDLGPTDKRKHAVAAS